MCDLAMFGHESDACTALEVVFCKRYLFSCSSVYSLADVCLAALVAFLRRFLYLVCPEVFHACKREAVFEGIDGA